MTAMAAGANAQPTTMTIGPAEFRAVELESGVDPISWAERAGVDPDELIRLPGGGSMLRFEMDEGVWRARRGALCTEPGVIGCDTDYCQSYFQDGGATTSSEEILPIAEVVGSMRLRDSRSVSETSIALVPRAPDLASLFATTPAITELDDALPGTQGCPAPSGESWRFIDIGDDGEFTLTLPEDGGIDRGCWELVAVAQCETRKRPLSDVLPEFELRRVLAVVDLAQVPAGADAALLAALTAATGLRVVDQTPLAAINKVMVRFELVGAESAEAAVALLGAQAGVEYAQHEFRHRTMATFDDPFAWMNYTVPESGAEAMHSSVLGEGVEIAVIDTGVDVFHPELTNRIVERLDVTGFGHSADRHGTAVAGIIGAEANNNIGAYGIAPGASLVAIKACQPEQEGSIQGRCWSSTLAEALNAVLERDTRIINLSLSGPQDRLVQELIEAALDGSRFVVAAAGNGGPDAPPSFPASLPGVMAVTAIDARERLYTEATRGDFVDIAAPGVEVPVPVPDTTYPGQLSGTSMATASVAGVAALLLSQQPELEAAAMRAALEASALPSADDEDRPFVGRGRVDACGASRSLGQSPPDCELALQELTQ
jgi:hypothetical protein